MKCKYCHQPAGFFSRAHKECKLKHENAKNEITKTVEECFLKSSSSYQDIEEKFKNICIDGYIEQSEYESLLLYIVKVGLRMRLSNNVFFVRSFISSLPENIKTKVRTDSLYVKYLAETIEKKLSAVDNTISVDNDLAKLVTSLSEDTSLKKLPPAIRKAALSGLDKRIDKVLEDGIIDDEEEKYINDYIIKTNLKGSVALSQSAAYEKLVQSLVLRDLQEGKRPERCASYGLPVLLGKTEYVVWVFRGVTGYEEKTGRKYVRGSRGVSMKVCKGVYYHAGASKGHTVTYQYKDNIGKGVLAITNKNIIFSGNKVIKIPISKVLSYRPYFDGIEITKEAANPKPYTFVGCNSWFIINAMHLLVP